VLEAEVPQGSMNSRQACHSHRHRWSIGLRGHLVPQQELGLWRKPPQQLPAAQLQVQDRAQAQAQGQARAPVQAKVQGQGRQHHR